MLALLLLHGGPFKKVLIGEQTDGLVIGGILREKPKNVIFASREKKTVKQFSAIQKLNLSAENSEKFT